MEHFRLGTSKSPQSISFFLSFSLFPPISLSPLAFYLFIIIIFFTYSPFLSFFFLRFMALVSPILTLASIFLISSSPSFPLYFFPTSLFSLSLFYLLSFPLFTLPPLTPSASPFPLFFVSFYSPLPISSQFPLSPLSAIPLPPLHLCPISSFPSPCLLLLISSSLPCFLFFIHSHLLTETHKGTHARYLEQIVAASCHAM